MPDLKLPRSIVSLALVTLGACVDPPPPDDPTVPIAPTDSVELGDGDGPATGDGDVTPDFAVDQPCGSATVTTLATGGDTRVVFCVRDGVEMLGEVRPLGTLSTLRMNGLSVTDTCLRDVFHALAPDRPIPQTLVDSCASRPIQNVSRMRPPTEEVVRPDEVLSASSYCGSNGATNFVDEQCHWWCRFGNGSDCAIWCIADGWGAHQRTMSAQIGDEGDYGGDAVASCNGSTRFRAWTALDTGDPWKTSLDFTVPSGTVASWTIMDTHAYEDIDMRFRGDSASGAFHRHSGTYQDW